MENEKLHSMKRTAVLVGFHFAKNNNGKTFYSKLTKQNPKSLFLS